MNKLPKLTPDDMLAIYDCILLSARTQHPEYSQDVLIKLAGKVIALAMTDLQRVPQSAVYTALLS